MKKKFLIIIKYIHLFIRIKIHYLKKRILVQKKQKRKVKFQMEYLKIIMKKPKAK